MQGIYEIRNRKNGKIYIGSSKNIKNRWRLHKTDMRDDVHHSPYLQRSYNKYGKEAFEFLVIEEIEEVESLRDVEQWYLDNCKPEYNVSASAYAPTKGKKHSKETIKKMSEIKMGKNNPFWNKTHSPETRKRISESLSGRKFTEEHKRKLGKKGEKHPLWGKHHTLESRRKMSESRRGENSWLSKLTDEKVLKARKMKATGNHTYKEIIEELDISVTIQCVYGAIVGKTWKHVGGPIKGVDY